MIRYFGSKDGGPSLEEGLWWAYDTDTGRAFWVKEDGQEYTHSEITLQRILELGDQEIPGFGDDFLDIGL